MMSMPYANDARPDTGLYNGKLGMWLFLAAEAMFFGALFSSYAFLRTAAAVWPDGSEILPITFAIFAGGAVILASTASARAWSSIVQRGERPTAALWMVALAGATMAGLILLSFLFEWGEGMRPATNTFYACWYLIAGLVGAHGVAGVVYALYLLSPFEDAKDPTRLRNRIECLGLFWQFVTIVWFVAFACFYAL